MINHLKAKLIKELLSHFGKDMKRINHALDVLSHAEALLLDTEDADAEIVLAVAVTHDFGIVEAEKRHNSSSGTLQEKYGPASVKPVLKRIGLNPVKTREVCRIIARHHSPPRNPGINFKILYESDCLVNIFDYPKIIGNRNRLESYISKNFSTEAGKKRARKYLLGEEDLFQRMGRVYKLMVNEKTRRNKEEPLLLEIAEKARQHKKRKKPRRLTQILDLGCGTGFHARLFARSGYSVTGIDKAESMLNEARKFRAKGLLSFQSGNILEPIRIKKPASLSLLLGNTLSTFKKLSDIGKIFKHVFAATRPGGYLLCQVINYDYLRAIRGKTVTRHGTISGMETFLTKELHPVEDGSFLITMTVTQKDPDNSWKSACKTTMLKPLKPKQLEKQARTAGFEKQAAWGDLSKSRFSQSKSTDCVLLFRKTERL